MAGTISIVIPVLDEAPGIVGLLQDLSQARADGVQIIVADGGSADSTVSLALPLCDVLVNAPRGRARQMNAGARQANGEMLLFLHADTQLPEGWMTHLRMAMADRKRAWGRFDVRITGRSPMLAVIGAMMNLRSRLTGIATGDQAMFMRRTAFEEIGGFPEIDLMEDIAMSGKLKRLSAPLCLRERVTTSGRRWDANGAWQTIWRMWRLRLAYFLGADPAILARQYGYRPGDQAK